MKTKTLLLGLFLAIATIIIPNHKGTELNAQPEITFIDNPDTFATDIEYGYIHVDDDWLIIVQFCPGILGLCN